LKVIREKDIVSKLGKVKSDIIKRNDSLQKVKQALDINLAS
jgi:hypothetical protein